jgi:hypothetical protein
MDPDWRAFLLGAAGSLAIEAINLYRAYEAGKRTPARYKRLGFYIVRIVIAGMAGLLAWAYHINNDILCIHIGAATPIILQSFAKSPPGEAEAEDT